MPESIAARAAESVFPVKCVRPDASVGVKGSGFKVRSGAVTSGHVVTGCPADATIEFDDGSGSVLKVDSPHDVALLTYVSSELSLEPRPLRAEPAHPYVGEPLALIGIPVLFAVPLAGFEPRPTITYATVLATHQTQQLSSPAGVPETLTDAIRVTTSGVAPGESGGPAIDAAGRVVGVIEGSGSGFATLTPVADLASLQ